MILELATHVPGADVDGHTVDALTGRLHVFHLLYELTESLPLPRVLKRIDVLLLSIVKSHLQTAIVGCVFNQLCD